MGIINSFKIMKKNVGILLFILCFGCVTDLKINPNNYTEKVILNGILSLNTPISITLHKSLKANAVDSNYTIIKNAKVSFFEDDKFIEEVTINEKMHYLGSFKPQEGKKYKVIAKVPDYGIVEAEETMPFAVHAKISKTTNSIANINQNPSFNIKIFSTNSSDYYWLSVIQSNTTLVGNAECPENRPKNSPLPKGCYLIDGKYTTTNNFMSNAESIDRFNGFYDSQSGHYLFHNYLKFKDFDKSQKNIDLNFTFYNQIPKGKGSFDELYINALVFGNAMNKYHKSALLFNNNSIRYTSDLFQNPFPEYVPVYTNVKNGVGIFGAIIENKIKVI